MNDILKRPYVLAMLDQHNHLDAVLLRSLQFRPEPLVILHYVVAYLGKVLFPVDD